MFKWLRQVPPRIGSIWSLRGYPNNPFGPGEYDVEVIAVKDGWVQFRFLGLLANFHRSIRDFRSLYREQSDA